MKSRMQTLFGLSHIVPKHKTVQNGYLHKFAEIIAEMPYDLCTATNCNVNEKRCLCCKSPAPKYVCKWHQMNVCVGCYTTAHKLCRNCVAMISEWARTTAQDEPGTCSVCFTSNNLSAMCSTCHPLGSLVLTTKPKATSAPPPGTVKLSTKAKPAPLRPREPPDVSPNPKQSRNLDIQAQLVYNTRWSVQNSLGLFKVKEVVDIDTFIGVFIYDREFSKLKVVTRSDLLSRYEVAPKPGSVARALNYSSVVAPPVAPPVAVVAPPVAPPVTLAEV